MPPAGRAFACMRDKPSPSRVKARNFAYASLAGLSTVSTEFSTDFVPNGWGKAGFSPLCKPQSGMYSRVFHRRKLWAVWIPPRAERRTQVYKARAQGRPPPAPARIMQSLPSAARLSSTLRRHMINIHVIRLLIQRFCAACAKPIFSTDRCT